MTRIGLLARMRATHVLVGLASALICAGFFRVSSINAESLRPTQPKSLEPIRLTLTRSVGASAQISESPQTLYDLGLFLNCAVVYLGLTGSGSASWQISFDSLPGMSAQPTSGFIVAPGVQACNLYLDRTGLPLDIYSGSIIVQWSIPATDVTPTRFQVADTIVIGGFAPPSSSPLSAGAVTFFQHEDSISLWSVPTGRVHSELRADGITPIGTDLVANLSGRGTYLWQPNQTVTVPLTADALTAISRLTLGVSPDGDDSARVIYTIQGAHHPAQCVQPPDVRARCGGLVQNQFSRADSGQGTVLWHQVSGPGSTDSTTGKWQWSPDCLDTGSFTVAATVGDLFFPSADTCGFQVTILDSSVLLFNQGDADCNGLIDVLDIVGMIGYLFGGRTICYTPLADWDCNGVADVLDLVSLLKYTFSNGTASNATDLVSAPTSVSVGDTAVFVASTCLPGREAEIQWYSPDGSPISGFGPIFKTTFAQPGGHITTFDCCQGGPDTITTTCW